MTTTDLCFASATDLQRLYRAGAASPRELMDAVFARIDAVNPKLNAYVTLARESALAEADAASRELTEGGGLARLHGVPVSIKYLTPTGGIRTTYGSKIHEH